MNYDNLMDSVNRNRSKKIKHRVEGKTLLEISEETGISLKTIQSRWRNGHRTYEELTKPTQWRRNYEERYMEACDRGRRVLERCNEKNMSIADLSRISGVDVSSIDDFIYNPNNGIQARTLWKICRTLNLTMDYVMGVR